MNNGFFGFPEVAYSKFIEVKTFDQTGIYNIPRNANVLLIYATSAGGGGGGGRSSTSDTNAGGGGGGGGGASTFFRYFVNEWVVGNGDPFKPYSNPQSLLITIGAGGSGGAGSTTAGATAQPGIDGGNTTLSIVGAAGHLVYLTGGLNGFAGTNSAGSGGGIQSGIHWGFYDYISGGRGNSGGTG
jgi:hypothetical protein